MKVILFFLVFLFLPLDINAAGVAVDYKGCNPVSKAGGLTDFALDKNGLMRFDPIDKNLQKHSLNDSQTEQVIEKKIENQPGKFRYALQRENGYPRKISVVVPTASGNGSSITLHYDFLYEGQNCYIGEVNVEYPSGENKGKKLVAYNSAMCDDLDEIFDSKSQKIAEACENELTKIDKVFSKYEADLLKEGKALHQFVGKGVREDPFHEFYQAMVDCKQTRNLFPNYDYKIASHKKGITIPGLNLQILFDRPQDTKNNGAK